VLELDAQPHLAVDVAKLVLAQRQRWAEQVRVPPLRRHLGHTLQRRRAVAEQLLQLGDGLGVRAQVGQHFAQAGQLALSAVEGPVPESSRRAYRAAGMRRRA
jgi:hypothetical protein